jgi:hypothetical protein
VGVAARRRVGCEVELDEQGDHGGRLDEAGIGDIVALEAKEAGIAGS